MSAKIDNQKAIENFSKYLTKETDAHYVAASLDDAYYALAQAAARAVDNGGAEDGLLCTKGSLEDAMYNIHRLREVLASPDPS